MTYEVYVWTRIYYILIKCQYMIDPLDEEPMSRSTGHGVTPAIFFYRDLDFSEGR